MCRCWRVHGEYDWVTSGDDYRLLVAALNARKVGSAKYWEWPKADHSLFVHASLAKAFGEDKEQKYDPGLTKMVLRWLKQH